MEGGNLARFAEHLVDLREAPRRTERPSAHLSSSPPRRIVTHAVGRIGDHKMRRDTTEHALNVGRRRAVAAEQSMAAEHP
jgi:hypothetical protein